MLNSDSYGGWGDESVRRAFIAKVCFILGMQLAVTAAIVSVIIFVDSVREWFFMNIWVAYICMAICTGISFILFCYINVARKVPINYILLFAFTVAEGITVGIISSTHEPKQILSAIGVTAVICIALMLFAIFAPCDFTGLGPYIFVISIAVMLICIVGVFFIKGRIMTWIICSAVLLLASLSLVYSIQLTIGGNHRNQFSEEDYVIAALCIYIDIINIFISILRMLGLIDE